MMESYISMIFEVSKWFYTQVNPTSLPEVLILELQAVAMILMIGVPLWCIAWCATKLVSWAAPTVLRLMTQAFINPQEKK